MINSMTGFGRSRKEGGGYSINVEIRALNAKQLDISVRMSKNYLEFEDLCRKLIAGKIRRGRIDVFVQIDCADIRRKAPAINRELARYYWSQLEDIHRELGNREGPSVDQLLRVPYIYETPEAVMDSEAVKELLSSAISEALGEVLQMRQIEGLALTGDFMNRLGALREDLLVVSSRRGGVIDEYRTKLHERIKLLLAGVEPDENRLSQEIAFMIDRADINEEIVRLGSHLEQVGALLSGSRPADGRRLDFLIQELHREASTIGSKTSDMEIVQAVVRIKTEIGKLKEQAQNVE
ncbi:MAG: YicC family protein [Syntrophobacteraceae bacterium]|nr:YicC family protein [Syntrophobacteraceae bacterium]